MLGISQIFKNPMIHAGPGKQVIRVLGMFRLLPCQPFPGLNRRNPRPRIPSFNQSVALGRVRLQEGGSAAWFGFKS